MTTRTNKSFNCQTFIWLASVTLAPAAVILASAAATAQECPELALPTINLPAPAEVAGRAPAAMPSTLPPALTQPAGIALPASQPVMTPTGMIDRAPFLTPFLAQPPAVPTDINNVQLPTRYFREAGAVEGGSKGGKPVDPAEDCLVQRVVYSNGSSGIVKHPMPVGQIQGEGGGGPIFIDDEETPEERAARWAHMRAESQRLRWAAIMANGRGDSDKYHKLNEEAARIEGQLAQEQEGAEQKEREEREAEEQARRLAERDKKEAEQKRKAAEEARQKEWEEERKERMELEKWLMKLLDPINWW